MELLDQKESRRMGAEKYEFKVIPPHQMESSPSEDGGNPILAFLTKLFQHIVDNYLSELNSSKDLLFGVELIIPLNDSGELSEDNMFYDSLDGLRARGLVRPKPTSSNYPLWHPIVPFQDFSVENIVRMAEKISQSNRVFDLTHPFTLFCTIVKK